MQKAFSHSEAVQLYCEGVKNAKKNKAKAIIRVQSSDSNKPNYSFYSC